MFGRGLTVEETSRSGEWERLNPFFKTANKVPARQLSASSPFLPILTLCGKAMTTVLPSVLPWIKRDMRRVPELGLIIPLANAAIFYQRIQMQRRRRI